MMYLLTMPFNIQSETGVNTDANIARYPDVSLTPDSFDTASDLVGTLTAALRAQQRRRSGNGHAADGGRDMRGKERDGWSTLQKETLLYENQQKIVSLCISHCFKDEMYFGFSIFELWYVWVTNVALDILGLTVSRVLVVLVTKTLTQIHL